MNEQQVIDILVRSVGWFAGVALLLVGAISGICRWLFAKLSARVDMCATKEELRTMQANVEKVERDLKEELRQHRNERQRRDDQVDRTLDEIKETVTGTHKRIDEIYRLIANQAGGGR